MVKFSDWSFGHGEALCARARGVGFPQQQWRAGRSMVRLGLVTLCAPLDMFLPEEMVSFSSNVALVDQMSNSFFSRLIALRKFVLAAFFRV